MVYNNFYSTFNIFGDNGPQALQHPLVVVDTPPLTSLHQLPTLHQPPTSLHQPPTSSHQPPTFLHQPPLLYTNPPSQNLPSWKWRIVHIKIGFLSTRRISNNWCPIYSCRENQKRYELTHQPHLQMVQWFSHTSAPFLSRVHEPIKNNTVDQFWCPPEFKINQIRIGVN